jgi:hypothetical protein
MFVEGPEATGMPEIRIAEAGTVRKVRGQRSEVKGQRSKVKAGNDSRELRELCH